MSMGPRNLLILFFSTVAVSLVILIIFFSMFFKGLNFNFNTRLPEAAPDIGRKYATDQGMNPDSRADGIMRSTVNVPPEFKEPDTGAGKAPSKAKSDEPLPVEELPPVSDDAILNHDVMDDAPPQTQPTAPPATEGEPSSRPTGTVTTSPSTGNRPVSRQMQPVARPVRQPERVSEPPTPQPDAGSEPASSGPPVPGQ